MIRRFISVLIFCCLFFSCRHGKNSPNILAVESVTSQTTEIKIPKNLDSLTFDYNSYIDNVDYIKLETNAQSRIGRIDRIIVTTSSFVVADYYLANAVFFFDRNGKFLKKISSIDDQAVPLTVGAISYDNQSQIIYVYLYNKDASYVNSYSNTGEFLKKIKMGNLYFDDFVAMSHSMFAFYMPGEKRFGNPANDYELAFGTRLGDVRSLAFKYGTENAVSKFGYNINVVSFGDYILFSKNYSRYIYQISGDPLRIYPRFEFSGGNKDSLFVELDSTLSVRDIKNLRSSKFSFSGRVLPTQNNYYFEFQRRGDRLGLFYSSETGHLIGGRPEARVYVGDSLKVDYYSYPMSSFENKFISVVDPQRIVESEKNFEILRKSAGVYRPLRTKKLDTLIQTVTDNQNPILMIYSLTSF